MLSFLLCSSTLGFSQFTKGQILTGGNFSVNFRPRVTMIGGTVIETTKSKSINLNPQLGYFFMDNFAAGSGLSLGSFSSKSANVKVTTNSIYFSPFVRYYYGNAYAQASAQFGAVKSKTESTIATTTTNSNRSGWSIVFGYAYLLNKYVSLEPQIGYSRPNEDQGGSTDFFIRAGLQIYLRR